jgi:arylsulfatase A-like enzyme
MSAPRKSVVLVTTDCLRADHCGFMGYQRPTTPFLDSLAGESFVFPTAIVAGAPTYYSLPAIIASRYPLAIGREVLGLAAEENNLASSCKEEGYTTAFFGAGNPYLSPRFGYEFGFDTFVDSLDADTSPLSVRDNSSVKREGWANGLNQMLASACHRVPGVAAAYDELYFQYCQRRAGSSPESLDALRRFPAADEIVEQAKIWLVTVSNKPFFLWLHFMDPHAPYYPTQKGLEAFGDWEVNGLTPHRARYLNAYWNRSDIGPERLRRHRDEVIALYDAGIRWVDAQVCRLVEILRQSKLWENCVFALTADHGEEFLEHGGRYHAPSLTEELIHVPLILRVPGAPKRSVSINPFSMLHLAPTLLAAAGLPVPTGFHGKSHWREIQEGSAWSEPAISECIVGSANPFQPEQRRGPRLLAVRETRYKLVFDFSTGSDCLFDLESDPGEQKPLPRATAKPERRRLLETALAHLQRSSARQLSKSQLRARLREIGINLLNVPANRSAVSAG